MSDENTLLTRMEAAEFLGVTSGTLANWAANNRYPIPYIKVGMSVQYRLKDLKDFKHLIKVIRKRGAKHD